MYKVVLSRDALKDQPLLKKAGLSQQAKELIDILKLNPFQSPPPFERLHGKFEKYYTRRITLHDRLVYEVDKKNKSVTIRRMWGHFPP